MFWGVTPALDFQEIYKANCNDLSQLDELNILIMGSADARHIIKTVSKCYLHEDIRINFYVIEVCVELIARQLLLLNIAFTPFEDLGLMLKTKLFMELYGNILVRPYASKFLSVKAKQLVKIVKNYKSNYDIMKFVNMDELTHKEIYSMEILFRFWSMEDKFHICDAWQRRVRRSLEVQDTKGDPFEWDLRKQLHPAGAKRICAEEYATWRGTGIAFTWPDTVQSIPNRSFVTGVVPVCETYLHQDYSGDILTSPFIAYGLNCKEEEMLGEVNDMVTSKAGNTTQHNLIHMFYEIINKKECPYKTNSELPANDVTEAETSEIAATNSKCISMDNIRVYFLSKTMRERLSYVEDFENFFNIIYYSNLMIDKISSNVINTISESNCLLVIENENYIPSLRTDRLEQLTRKIIRKTGTLKHVNRKFINPKKDSYTTYVVNPKKSK